MRREIKTHMINRADSEGDFMTVCGIGTYAKKQPSEKFKESGNIMPFGETVKTTCKRCLRVYLRELEKEKSNNN